VRVAYADPPYFGCCGLYGHEHGADGRCWNDEETHAALIQRLCREFPDGWALSCHVPSLRMLLEHCPDDGVRIGAWVKSFAVFKPHVNPAYAWEPVIWMGGRSKRGRDEATVRDWCRAAITLEKGLVGAKPEAFVRWLIDLMGLREDDELVDLFPGSGVVRRTWEAFRRQGELWKPAI